MRSECEEKDREVLLIHQCTNGKDVRKVSIVGKNTFIQSWFRKFIKDNNIMDINGEYYNLTSHQFRRTLGTDICDRLLKRQKLYACSRYITTPEYLEAHKQHLANLEKQLEEGSIYVEHYAENFIPTIEVLKIIINYHSALDMASYQRGIVYQKGLCQADIRWL
ncbi:MAG: hypothetical protein ACERKZ_06730 [Lachnotalea sp.]